MACRRAVLSVHGAAVIASCDRPSGTSLRLALQPLARPPDPKEPPCPPMPYRATSAPAHRLAPAPRRRLRLDADGVRACRPRRGDARPCADVPPDVQREALTVSTPILSKRGDVVGQRVAAHP